MWNKPMNIDHVSSGKTLGFPHFLYVYRGVTIQIYVYNTGLPSYKLAYNPH